MSIPRIIAELCGTVWAHEPTKLETISHVLLRKNAGEAFSFEDDDEDDGEKRARQREEAKWKALLEAGSAAMSASDGATAQRTEYGGRVGSVAMISVAGMIAKHASMVNGRSQPTGTSLDVVRSNLAAARADKSVKSIAVVFDSPGGYADGVAEFGDEIFGGRSMQADGGKPMYAYVSGLAASAAYWSASQMSRIEAGVDGRVGSIGTYMVAWDSSRAAENDGYKAYIVRSPDTDASVKGAGSPGTPITDRALKAWQRGTDGYQSLFHAAVMRGRGLSSKAVEAMSTGETWMGDKALSLGLVDAVRPLGAMVADMHRSFGGATGGGGAGGSKAKAETAAGLVVGGAGVGVVAAPALSIESAAESAQSDGKDPMKMLGIVGPLLALSAAAAGMEGGGGGGGAVATVDADLDRKIQEGVAAREAQVAERAASFRALATKYANVAGVSTLIDASAKDLTITAEAFRTKLVSHCVEHMKPVGSSGGTTFGGGSGLGLSDGAGGAGSISVGTSGAERFNEAAAIGLAIRANPRQEQALHAGGPRAEAIARALGHVDVKSAMAAVREARQSGFTNRSLRSLAEQHILSTGKDPFAMGPDNVFAATFGQGTGDFPSILQNVAGKTMEMAFAEYPATWDQWCAIGSVPDFKSASRVGLSEAANLALVKEGESIKAGILKDRGYSVTTATYGKGFGLSRQAFYNDDLAAFASVPQLMGEAAARLPEDLAFAMLVANGVTFDNVALFHSTHANTNSAAALSMTALYNLILLVRQQKGFGENTAPLDLRPDVILTGLQLEGTAKELYANENDPTAANNNGSKFNQVRGLVRPLATPRITSSTAYYVIDSKRPPIELTFLNGQRRPQIVQKAQQSIADGPQWEVMFDCNANYCTWEGAAYNAGA